MCEALDTADAQRSSLVLDQPISGRLLRRRDLDGAASLKVKEVRMFREQGAKIYVTYECSTLLHELLHNGFPEPPKLHQNRCTTTYISQ
jgi:hypothetical protein